MCWVEEMFLLNILDKSGSAIKGNAMQKIIRDAGHILLYLLLYSPDLNPIEHKWAHAKQIRCFRNCLIDVLFSITVL
ncbi:hypothetical protein HCUR_00582 [Holospora curviuscula]|uniref:Tc1-like transposase DDE domain-containing protein n=2 Tax=Holospora curviuscula TaxID=1082868 RepID=A0A2S5R9R6_9PROT|nr:hypothetical protein HCUR_00582 [Holospora curviuscula]